MDWKGIFFALVVFSISATGLAADVEPAKRPAADGISSPSATASFFEGVWEGTWPWGRDGVELTITISKRNKNGQFGTTYSWGMGRLGNGRLVKSGSFKVWGKEQGDRFLIEWKNKEGASSTITLFKGEREDSVKAITETDGSSSQSPLSDRTTYLKRK